MPRSGFIISARNAINLAISDGCVYACPDGSSAAHTSTRSTAAWPRLDDAAMYVTGGWSNQRATPKTWEGCPRPQHSPIKRACRSSQIHAECRCAAQSSSCGVFTRTQAPCVWRSCPTAWLDIHVVGDAECAGICNSTGVVRRHMPAGAGLTARLARKVCFQVGT